MNFLADMGVSMSTVQGLRNLGHGAVHLREEGLARLPDGDILDKARRENRVLLTFDLDFGDLLARGGLDLPSVVIFRMRDQTPATVLERFQVVLSERETDILKGAIVIVEDFRYRIRRLPIVRGREEHQDR